MRDIRLIAMDLDGTLLNSDQKVSQGNAETLRQAARQGVKIALCSARAPGALAQLALENGLNDAALLSLNGTYSLLSPLGEPFGNHMMNAETLNAVVRILQEEEMSFVCHAQNRVVLFLKPHETPERFWLTTEEKLLLPEMLFGMDGLAHVTKIGANKVLTLADSLPQWERCGEKLRRIEGLNVSCSWPLDFELLQEGYDKGSAVRELAETLGLQASQVMTLGDYDNDISMLKYAGLGVAMGNGSDAAKQAADWVTLSNDEDGVAHAIRTYALT